MISRTAYQVYQLCPPNSHLQHLVCIQQFLLLLWFLGMLHFVCKYESIGSQWSPQNLKSAKTSVTALYLEKKYVLSCKQNYWFNADLVFWKHRSNMDGWIQWSWSILGEHILQLSLCMLFWSQQPVLPMCMLHLLTRAAEVGSGESFFKHKRKQRIKKKKNVVQYLSSKQQFCWTAGRCRSEYGQQVESWGRCVRKAHNQQEISSTQAHICFCFPCERGEENFNVIGYIKSIMTQKWQ